jgi:hypothetical protein
MTRDPVLLTSPQTIAVKCHDVRAGFSARHGTGISLTEWALVEAHLRQCAECRQEQARRQQVAAPPRALLDSLGKAMEVTRIALTRPTALLAPWRARMTATLTRIVRAGADTIQAIGRGIGQARDLIARLHAVLAATLTLTARACAAAIQVVGRGIGQARDLIARLHAALLAARTLTARSSSAVLQAAGRGVGQAWDLIARLHAVLVATLTLTARACAAAIQAVGRGIGQARDLIARLHAALAAALTLTGRSTATVRQAIGRGVTRFVAWQARHRSFAASPLKTSAWLVGVGLVLAFVLYTLQFPPLGPPQHVRSPVTATPTIAPTQDVSFLPPPPVASPVESYRAAPARPRTNEPRPSPSRASTSARPAPIPESKAPVTDIVGRLAAKDRTAAERDFTALLAGVGGTELGRQRHGAFTALEVVVPQSRYSDFARGLTRLGSWQLEAARSPLPDAVHMTIRVSE